MTPAQLNICARAKAQLRQTDSKQRQAEIYALAGLIRQMIWAKHPPSLQEVFPELDEAEEDMTDSAMLQAVLRINEALGGTVETAVPPGN